jgi:hypothetical protein
MITSQRRPVLSPPVTRHFESTRTHKQSIGNAYQILMPIVSRHSGRPRSRPDDHTTGAVSPGSRPRAEGA